LTTHKHTDQSSNKNKHRLLTVRGPTHRKEVGEQRDPYTETGITIVHVLIEDPSTTTIAIEEGHPGITYNRCYQIYAF
jgi:hypothetical protein